MTQLRKCQCANSNLLDNLEAGIGHRGSSFADLDAVCRVRVPAITHDGRTHRFLVREVKQGTELLPEGQRRLLCDLALEQRFTVWLVRFQRPGVLAWADMLHEKSSATLLSYEQYRERLALWWRNRYDIGRYTELDADIYQRTSAAEFDKSVDAYADATFCDICGRESCEDHLPPR